VWPLARRGKPGRSPTGSLNQATGAAQSLRRSKVAEQFVLLDAWTGTPTSSSPVVELRKVACVHPRY
jgi:hypothetical protein